MLAVCIVDKHHRELQRLCIVQLNEPEDTCCGLLTTSDHVWNEVCVFCVHEVYKVTAIVDDDVRTDLEHAADVRLVFLRGSIIPCKHIQSCLNEGRGHVVLSRKRVTSCHIHFRTACRENFAQVSGLCLEVH